jgi:dihydrofolate reductase
MRKLKLQMQMSVDGYVAGPNGELDWMHGEWDDELIKYTGGLTNSIDTILLGRKMTDGFVSHWTNVMKNTKDSEYKWAKIFVDTPKVVFTKTLNKSIWINTTLAKGNLTDEIAKLKNQPGKDIIVYGGAGFVSSLIKEGLIDELHLFVNPVAIGNGMTIFKSLNKTQIFSVLHSTPYSCGITVSCYKQINN